MYKTQIEKSLLSRYSLITKSPLFAKGLILMLLLGISFTSLLNPLFANTSVETSTVVSNHQSTDNTVQSFASQLIEKYPNKIVYVDFWASWCGPCRKSFPFLNSINEKYSDDLIVIAVNEDEDKRQADKFLQKYTANFEIVYDPDGKIATEMELIAMPSSYIFDKRGELVGKHAGFRKGDAENIEQALVGLIAQEKLSEQNVNTDRGEK